MTAHTVDQHGNVIRWHLDEAGTVAEECRGDMAAECVRRHATMADLAFCQLIGEARPADVQP